MPTNYGVFEKLYMLAVFILIIAVFAGFCINRLKKRRKQSAELEKETFEPKPIEAHIARVKFKDVTLVNSGIYTPQHHISFFAVFEFEGREIKLSVPKERYEELTVDSVGRLIIEDGKFLDFTDSTI